jgi:hypothetical protein
VGCVLSVGCVLAVGCGVVWDYKRANPYRAHTPMVLAPHPGGGGGAGGGAAGGGAWKNAGAFHCCCCCWATPISFWMACLHRTWMRKRQKKQNMISYRKFSVHFWTAQRICCSRCFVISLFDNASNRFASHASSRFASHASSFGCAIPSFSRSKTERRTYTRLICSHVERG